MNYGISVLFRLIPLLTGLFCFFYGGCIYLGSFDEPARVAGPVVFFLGAVCLALCCIAATVVRQTASADNWRTRYLFPALGYAAAVATFIVGLVLISQHETAGFSVSGHVVCGLALVTLCLATVAAASIGFSYISENSSKVSPEQMQASSGPAGFMARRRSVIMCIPVLVAAAAWIWALLLLTHAHEPAHLAAGSILLGAACVCTVIIALVASIVRQIRNIYRNSERSTWRSLSISMGAVAFVFGVALLVMEWNRATGYVGFVLIGLGMVCWSLSSAVILLAKMWRADYPLARRLSLVPLAAALICVFMAAFLFERADFTAARILMGFGAVCFAIFPIVCIIESGAKVPHHDLPLSEPQGKNIASSE